MTLINANQVNHVLPVLGEIQAVSINQTNLNITVIQLDTTTMKPTGLSHTYQISMAGYNNQDQSDRWIGNALGAYLSVYATPDNSMVNLESLVGETVLLFEHYYFSSDRTLKFINVTDIFPINLLPNIHKESTNSLGGLLNEK